MFALPLFQRRHAPRWGVFEHAASAQSPDDARFFTAVVVHGQQVLTQTGVDLPSLMSALLLAFERAWPALPRVPFFKTHVRPTAWVIPDTQCLTFEWTCLPSWGPPDIEAECRLEASVRMQLAPHQVALDYQVHQPVTGSLQATVWAYEAFKLHERMAHMKELGFDLQVFTAQSQALGLASFFRHSFKSQQALQQRISEQLVSYLRQGEVPC